MANRQTLFIFIVLEVTLIKQKLPWILFDFSLYSLLSKLVFLNKQNEDFPLWYKVLKSCLKFRYMNELTLQSKFRYKRECKENNKTFLEIFKRLLNKYLMQLFWRVGGGLQSFPPCSGEKTSSNIYVCKIYSSFIRIQKLCSV